MKLRNTIFQYIISFFILSVNTLSATWDPELLRNDSNSISFDILNNPKVQQLENSIYKALQGSWCSQEKAKLIFEVVTLTRPAVCVEIGAFTGSCTLPMVAGLKYLHHGKAYIIDAWSNSEVVKNLHPNDPNTIWWSTLDMKAVKNQCLHMINTWSLSSYCKVIQSPSTQAASQISFIDFLHLDGNFSEEGALEDSLTYLPKVKSGGYILFSNLLMIIDGKATKSKALWPVFDACDIVCELENGNTILFRKR